MTSEKGSNIRIYGVCSLFFCQCAKYCMKQKGEKIERNRLSFHSVVVVHVFPLWKCTKNRPEKRREREKKKSLRIISVFESSSSLFFRRFFLKGVCCFSFLSAHENDDTKMRRIHREILFSPLRCFPKCISEWREAGGKFELSPSVSSRFLRSHSISRFSRTVQFEAESRPCKNTLFVLLHTCFLFLFPLILNVNYLSIENEKPYNSDYKHLL